MKKLPKTIYVRWDGDVSDEFLNAYSDLNAHADMGEKRTVGVYQLVRTSIVGVEVVEQESK